MNGSKRRAFALAAAFAVACSDRPPPPPAEQAVLGGEVVARVGTEIISVSLVAKVAADQHVEPREALRRLIDDAVCAQAARTRGLDRQLPAAWKLTAARARLTADRTLTEARSAGPATENEIKTLTERHWREVDRPEAVRVVHAVAQRPRGPGSAGEEKARALAAEVRVAVLAATDAEDFQTKAKAVPHPGVDLTVQPLPPFEEGGYVTDGEGQMDVAFAKAAFALPAPGSTSAVVESRFGWHVIRLVERIPEQRMPLEARRLAFTEEAYTERARAAAQARLDVIKASSPVEVSPSAELLMRSLLGTADRGPAP